MRYENVVTGIFRKRPNRFTAWVDVDGAPQLCHVKNTGRCRELLVDGATVYLEERCSDTRKTKFDLIAVEKGDRLINMDSQAPNKVAGEYLKTLFPDARYIKPEVKHGNSRFDFYLETENDKWFIEVKGVTLEDDGVVMFPDAPTERGLKHINELTACLDSGYKAMALFIIQMKDVKYFTPNYMTHPQFGEALKRAERAGVRLEAVDCIVTPDSLTAYESVAIRL